MEKAGTAPADQRATRHQVFLTSHDVADIEHVAKRAIVINQGEVIYDAEVAAMRRRLMSTKVIEVALSEPVSAPTAPGIGVIDHSDVAMKLSVDTSTTTVRTVLDLLLVGTAVSDLTVVDPPLEDVIASIYRQAVVESKT